MFFFNQECASFKPRSIESAYLAILNNDLRTASAIFESLDSPRARWGLIFVSILEGFIKIYPSYFEIRNFLEIDLDFLIKNEKVEYIEYLLSSLEVLVNINQETYKYIARVMYENKYYNAAREYLEKSKKVFYKDPELHFMLSKYYYESREYEEAMFYIKECLKILPDYYPAKLMKQVISKYISENW